jgi:hypothetical protein
LLLELLVLQLHGLLQHGHALAVGVALEASQLQLADALTQLTLPAEARQGSNKCDTKLLFYNLAAARGCADAADASCRQQTRHSRAANIVTPTEMVTGPTRN